MATEAPEFEAVVLAAGAGRRFGGGKLLAPWAGGALLDGALAAAFAAPVRRVIVVTGTAAAEVEALARDHAARSGASSRLLVVHADDHEEGMGASLRRAAAELPANCAGAFVFLGDMPRVPHAVLGKLVAAVRAGAPAAAPVFEGQRGHPALIGSGLLPQLRTLSGDAGARAILKGLGQALALVEAPDDGVLFDVDERSDLDR
ncbi:MAG: molybdopterin-guanine dinucleotide biosynthesis protein MobA [Phenylobacterium sp.]|uniref:nucleotidyltransferase family protein n=1 Tax=Phenylobacterium sp. TaxID=1871053 RepID=UPI0025DAE3B6|nr:NTP transferase domain-containing protein [Phenylobacterium sp.]MBA4012770.1 molybdopterin-guanine dinucleotide biosynthesis protein MobA [Phenylobacterium sp.]